MPAEFASVPDPFFAFASVPDPFFANPHRFRQAAIMEKIGCAIGPFVLASTIVAILIKTNDGH